MKRLLIAGFGDVARRAAPLLESRFAVVRLSRREGYDLARPETLRLGACDALLHCAPPPATGDVDTRTVNLLAALTHASLARIVYISTSGVYGDCGGARVDESRALRPQTSRAWRRVDAERQLESWCTARAIPLLILRAPGIYATDRLPIERLRARLPVLRREDDAYTSHFHAPHLPPAGARALGAGAPRGPYHPADATRVLKAASPGPLPALLLPAP